MASRDLTVTIRGNADDFTRAMKAAQTNAGLVGRELTKLERDQMKLARAAERAAEQQRAAMTQVGTAVGGFGLAVSAGVGLAVKSAVDWETAWAGVTKTVGGNAAQMGVLEDSLRQLAKELPATHTEIAAVAEAAGALGVKRENIVSFTRTMINLGQTTDLTADQAANALARISNVMGTGQGDVDRFGSALVALGNDGASTESEIVTMAQRISGAAKQVGLSEGDLLGVASALSSVGIEAEAGGSSFSTFLVRMSAAVQEGGTDLENFARVAGMSSEQFATGFREDAAGATVAFVEGLGRIQASGGDTFGTLEALGLSEIRLRDALLRTAGAGDLLSDSIRTGNVAWGENSALTEEAAKRYETTAGQLGIARNNIADLGITLGETFLPLLGQVAEKTGAWAGYLGDLPQPLQQAAGWVGGLTGALSLATGAFLVGAPKVAEFRNAIDDMGPRAQAAGTALRGVGSILMGPWGVGLAAGVTALGFFINAKAEAAAKVDAFTAAIQADSGALGQNTNDLILQTLAQDDLLQAARESGISIADLVNGIKGEGDARRRVIETLDAQSKQTALESGVVSESANKRGDLRRALEGNNTALQQGLLDARLMAEADAALGEQSAVTGEAAAGQAVAQDGLNVELDDGISAADGLKASLDALTGTHLGADEALVRYHDAVRRANQAIIDNKANTDLTSEAGGRNNDALRAQAEAAQALTVAQLDLHGPTNAIRDGFFQQRQQLFETARQMGYNEGDAWRLTDAYLAIPKELETVMLAETGPAAETVARWLRENRSHQVTVTVSADTGPAAAAVQAYLRRNNLRAPGLAGRGEALGGIAIPMASGGMLRRDIAQTVPPNQPVIMGDRMHGKEYFLPDDDAPRTMAIGEQWAHDRGYRLVPMRAGGILGLAVGGALAPGGAGSVSGFPGMPGVPMDPDMVDELAGSVQTLTEQALAPLSTELTGVTVPALQLVQQHAGTDSVDAITALGETLPPLTAATVTSGQTMQATWAQNAATVLGTSQQQRDTWAGDTAAVAGTQVAQTGQYQLLQANLGVATVGMTQSVAAMQGAHNASWSDMAAQSGANIATITGPQFAGLHAGLTAVEQHATNTADWWGGQLGRLPVLTGTPVRALLTGPMNAGLVPAWNAIDRFFALGKVMGPVPIGFARGTEDHRAQIAYGTQPRIWNEPEAEGEAYIPLAMSKRGRSTAILDHVAGEFGYALEPRYFADGGLWRQMQAIVQRGVPGARISSTYRPGVAGYHGSGRAIDIGSPEAASNRWLAQNYPNSSELIYTPGINLLNGRPFTYSPSTRADHFDHTHWAMANAAMLGGQPGAAALPFFDIGPMIEGYFAETRRMIAGIIPAHGPGNVPTAATKFGNDAVAGAVRHATDRMMVSIGPGGGAGVERWRGVGLRALAIAGQPASEIGRLLMQMNSESGGNPTAVNRNDINWINGTPSVGLMQVIGPTYRSHRHPQFDTGPYLYGTSTNPLSNILASTRYTLARYGSLARGWRGVGYGDGGVATEDGPAWLHAGERVLPPRQTEVLDRILEVLTTKRGISFAAMAGAGAAAATVIHKHYALTVYDAGNTRVDLETQFARLEMRAGI